MAVTIADVDAQDAEPVRTFMIDVIAESVTREEPVFSDLVGNVSDNLAWALAYPAQCVHLKAEIDGALAGVVLVKEYWNLCSLFVAPALRGRGLGRALVEAAAERCRDRSPRQALWLNAAPDAVPFYRRLGFTSRPATRPLPPGFEAMLRPL